MRQLDADEVRALQDGQQVHVKLTRLYYPTASVAYEGPAALYVARHPKTGETVTLTVRDPLNWAEYDPRRDIESYNGTALVTEDWQMEIFEPVS